MENPVYCDRCGKCMTYESGESIVGIKINLPAGVDSLCLLKDQLGKYKVKDYAFCMECWLDSLLRK